MKLKHEIKWNGAEQRRLRSDRGLSQWLFAWLIGISQQSVCDYETGRREPTLKVAAEIAAELGTTIEDMIIREDP